MLFNARVTMQETSEEKQLTNDMDKAKSLLMEAFKLLAKHDEDISSVVSSLSH